MAAHKLLVSRPFLRSEQSHRPFITDAVRPAGRDGRQCLDFHIVIGAKIKSLTMLCWFRSHILVESSSSIRVRISIFSHFNYLCLPILDPLILSYRHLLCFFVHPCMSGLTFSYSWSSGQLVRLLIMRSWFRSLALP